MKRRDKEERVIADTIRFMKQAGEYGIEGLPPEAVAFYVVAIKKLEEQQPGEALELLNTIAKVLPQAAPIYRLRARAYLALDDLDRAMAEIERATSLAPKDGKAQHLRGLVHRKRGEVEDALRCFRRSEELEPDPANRFELAELLVQLDEEEEAIDVYESAFLLDHRRIDALHERGELLMLHRAFVSALADFSVCCLMQPKQAQHWVNRGNAFYELGDFDSAENDYQTALSLDDNLPEVSMNLGCIALDEGKIEVSLAHFDHALSMRPDYTRAVLNRGLAYYFANNDAACEADLVRASELENGSCDALFALARLYARQRRYRQSTEALGKALATCPDFVDDLYEDDVFEELLKLKDVKRMVAKAREELNFL